MHFLTFVFMRLNRESLRFSFLFEQQLFILFVEDLSCFSCCPVPLLIGPRRHLFELVSCCIGSSVIALHHQKCFLTFLALRYFIFYIVLHPCPVLLKMSMVSVKIISFILSYCFSFASCILTELLSNSSDVSDTLDLSSFFIITFLMSKFVFFYSKHNMKLTFDYYNRSLKKITLNIFLRRILQNMLCVILLQKNTMNLQTAKTSEGSR